MLRKRHGKSNIRMTRYLSKICKKECEQASTVRSESREEREERLQRSGDA